MRPYQSLACLLVLIAPIAGCTTGGGSSPEVRTRAECERLAEERRSQRDRNVLNAQDRVELRLDGCVGR